MLVRLMLVTRWVFVRETGQVMGVQRMGPEPRPWLGESRADPPPQEPSESHTGDGGEWGGAARGRVDRPPPAIAAGSDRAYRFSRRGTIRAVSGGSRLI